MKNFIKPLIMAALILCTRQANAQLVAGFKAGMNYAGFSNHDGNKRLSGHAGAFIHTVIGKKIHLQPELLYSGEGQQYTVTENETEVQQTAAVAVVALPVMLQYFTGKSFYIEAGPQVSVIAAAKLKSPSGEKLYVRRSMSNTQFGFNAGAGLMLNKQLGISVRYHLGLTDLTLDDNDADYSRVLSAGVFFRLK